MKNSKQIKNKIYENYFDSIYRTSNTFNQKEYEITASHFDMDFGHFIPAKTTAEMLDIGCGAGHFLYFLRTKGYTNYFGIDVSKSQIKFCKKFITTRCKTADAFEYLKNKKNVYSIVSAHDVLEHIPKEKVIMFLEVIYSALKPGASLLLKLPNMSNPFALNNRYRDFSHECGFTEKSIYQVLYLAGFREIIIKPQQTSRKSMKNIMDNFILSILYFSLKKLFWYQGFVAPKILSSRLVIIAKK